jgi:hypothetical protein
MPFPPPGHRCNLAPEETLRQVSCTLRQGVLVRPSPPGLRPEAMTT